MRIFASLLLFGGLVACSDPDEPLTSEGTMLSSNAQDTCGCELLVEDEKGVLKKDKNPYTGVCFSNYPGSEDPYIFKNILEGKLHGPVTYYSREGEIYMEETYEYGTRKRSGASGDNKCNCSELKIAGQHEGISKFTLDDIPFTGTCTEMYPDSSGIYLESNYKEGLLSGKVTYYDRNSKVLYYEVYEQGYLVNTIYGSEN